MQDSPVYNAFERDIAVLNIFFCDLSYSGGQEVKKVSLA